MGEGVPPVPFRGPLTWCCASSASNGITFPRFVLSVLRTRLSRRGPLRSRRELARSPSATLPRSTPHLHPIGFGPGERARRMRLPPALVRRARRGSRSDGPRPAGSSRARTGRPPAPPRGIRCLRASEERPHAHVGVRRAGARARRVVLRTAPEAQEQRQAMGVRGPCSTPCDGYAARKARLSHGSPAVLRLQSDTRGASCPGRFQEERARGKSMGTWMTVPPHREGRDGPGVVLARPSTNVAFAV